jgi:hypothetical protein
MNLAYDKRNFAGAVAELVRLAPERTQGGTVVGRGSRVVDLTQPGQAEDFLRYQAEKLAGRCIDKGCHPTLEWPILCGVAFWSIDVSIEPYTEHDGNGTLMPLVDGEQPAYLVRFLKFLGA